MFSFVSLVITSIPDFFLFIAIQYLIIIAMKSGFPPFEMYSSDAWYSFLLPCLSLTLFPLFHMVKITVVAMESEVGEEYVRTAVSKGMTENRVLINMILNGWLVMVYLSLNSMFYIVC